MKTIRSLRDESGAVIVIALFFMALIATMAYYMMSRLERDTHRTSLLLRSTQAELYAAGSVDWAIDQLRTNLKNKKPNVICDNIPIQSPVNEVNGYTISSKITDMQSRINLNNLTTPEAQVNFKRLVKLLDPDMDEGKINALVLALSDWLTPTQQENVYSQYYLHLSPPYRAAHRPMMSASELQLEFK
jgi:general secretion pathway protein K